MPAAVQWCGRGLARFFIWLLGSAFVFAHAAETPPSATTQPPPALSGGGAAGSQSEASTVVPTPSSAVLINVPALTPVKLRLGDEISSNTSKSGDRFALIVAEDVKVGDAVVIPAGSTGEGEVIHAAKSGAGGKAGELILTARFVRVGEQTVRLRSFVAGGTGVDRSGTAMATAVVAGPFAMFVRGGVIVIPVDTVANAKTLETVQLPEMRAGLKEPSETPHAETEPAAPAPELQKTQQAEEER